MLSNNALSMAKRDFGAVAVDLGASSARFAAGWVEDGAIRFETIEQRSHQPIERNGRLEWDLAALVQMAKSAGEYARDHFSSSTLGIDAWGVDHGFIDSQGALIGDPVCYRDLSHERAFESLREYREELYALTGIQHQPFNTICQLAARKLENPDLPRDARFLILPDLIGFLLTGEMNHELTEASTTQLMGLDCRWSARAFEIAGWSVPDHQPALPGTIGASVVPSVRLARVGSHDTASALVGFGAAEPNTMYVNVGTWSLAMFPIDEPIATPAAEAANFTNERMADGRVRFLKNIPGFYVLNRLHEELKVDSDIPTWIESLVDTGESIDLFDNDFFNPASMVAACAKKLGRLASCPRQWAGIGIRSLAMAIADQPSQAVRLGVPQATRIRIAGGGSQSKALCQMISDVAEMPVIAGPVEATLLGNLAFQFRASGVFDSDRIMENAIECSAARLEYSPQ
jgi:rhamnulokinase